MAQNQQMAITQIYITRLLNVLALVLDNPAKTDAEDLSDDNILSRLTS